MVWIRKVTNFVRLEWPLLSYLILGVLAFAYFTFFQAVPTFADPDSFYHVKMALLIPQQGVMKSFPWLQFTILRDSYIDQHFLYHVYLIPFVHLMDPLQGAKLANVVLCTGLTLIFYWFLRSQKVKFAFVATLILLATMPFVFRVNLVKAPAFSLLIALVGLGALFRHRYVALFITSFVYVWAYGGFIVILIFSGLYAAVGFLHDWWHQKRRQSTATIFLHNREIRLFLASLAGVLSGLLANPQFPRNIIFYWHQLVKIGIINYQKVIPVGNEWYPYKFIDLTAGSAMVSVVLLVAFYLFVVDHRKVTKKFITLFFIFLFFLVFTLKSSRYVEYYVPFALIFGVFALNSHLLHFDWSRLWSHFLSFYMKHRIITTILIIYFLATLPTVIIKDVRHTYGDLKGGIPLGRFSQASAWLAEHSQPGDIVFHSSWDEFPVLFYYNSKNYYIAGLDPTFSYEFNQDLYKKMVNITLGDQSTNLYDDIKHNFRAAYVLVEKNHIRMNDNIRQESGFQDVYSDNDATIYQVL